MTARHTTLVCSARPADRVRGTSNQPDHSSLQLALLGIDAGPVSNGTSPTSTVTVTSGAFDSNDDGISEYAHLECTTKAVPSVNLFGVGITAMGSGV